MGSRRWRFWSTRPSGSTTSTAPPNARADYLDEILGRSPVAGADLIVMEVLQGFTDEQEWETARAALRKFRTYVLNDSVGLKLPDPGTPLCARG